MYEKGSLQEKILFDNYEGAPDIKKPELNITNSKTTSTKTLNLISNPQYDSIKPIRAISSQSFAFIERKIISTTHFLFPQIEYWTTIFNYSIGYGTLWRFPYYFQLSYGAVFFIPFFIFFFVLGIPLLSMESALGQIFKATPDELMIKIKKKLYGLGLVSIISSFIINVYLFVIKSWCIYFFFVSFQSPLPWDFEFEKKPNNLLHKDFFSHQIINVDFDNNTNNIILGSLNKTLLLCLLITWVLIFLVNFLNIKLNSKILYITSLFPIILLIIIFFDLFSLPHGFGKGTWFFIIPRISKLLDYKVWLYSCNQAVFTLMLGFGGNILFSSKKSEDEDIYQRSLFIAFTQLITGLMCTFINCIVCGFMANELGINEIENLPFNKASLPFIVYPLALGMMKYSNLWSLLFFGMMILISIQSQMIFYEGLSIFISQTLNKYFTYRDGSIFLCILGLICGIPFITQGGFFLLEWIDRYATMVPLFLVILMETLTIMRNIGIGTIREIIANKTGMVFPGYVLASNGLLSPIVMGLLIIFSFIYHLCDLPDNIVFFILLWVLMVFLFILIFFYFIKLINEKVKKQEEKVQKILNGDNTIPEEQEMKKLD